MNTIQHHILAGKAEIHWDQAEQAKLINELIDMIEPLQTLRTEHIDAALEFAHRQGRSGASYYKQNLAVIQAVKRLHQTMMESLALKPGLMVILSLEHQGEGTRGRPEMRKDSILFWRANGAGYTTSLEEAGRYEPSKIHDEAHHYNNGESTRAVPLRLLLHHCHKAVSFDEWSKIKHELESLESLEIIDKVEQA